MREFLEELRDHWDDGYYWADRQLLLAVLVALCAGAISLGFTYLELRMKGAMGDVGD